MCGHRTQNLLILRSSQLPDRDIHVGMDRYRWYAGFSPACKGSAMLSQSNHWSKVCRTCSAAPDVPKINLCRATRVHRWYTEQNAVWHAWAIAWGGMELECDLWGSGRPWMCFMYSSRTNVTLLLHHSTWGVNNLSMLLFGVENFHVFKIHRRPPTINRKITMVVPLPYCHSKPNICMYLVLRVHRHRFHPLVSLAERVLQSVSCG